MEKCKVCGEKKYVRELGYCESVCGKWMTVKKEKGYCRKCKFRFFEGSKSFEDQAKEYKKRFIKKLVSKINKNK